MISLNSTLDLNSVRNFKDVNSKAYSRQRQFKAKQSQMTDAELINLAQGELSKLCKTGGKSLRMTVPPMITDTDMVFSEIIRRFKNKIESEQ